MSLEPILTQNLKNKKWARHLPAESGQSPEYLISDKRYDNRLITSILGLLLGLPAPQPQQMMARLIINVLPAKLAKRIRSSQIILF